MTKNDRDDKEGERGRLAHAVDAAENVRQGCAKKGRSRAHEGVAEVAVVGTILHFLREDDAGVAAPGDMENLDSTVKDPLPDRVLAEFHVTDPLGWWSDSETN